MDLDSKVTARKKVAQIFKYLQALDQLRNPVIKNIQEQPWAMWFNKLPEHLSLDCPFQESVRAVRMEGYEANHEDDYLCVRRPDLTVCPEPPLTVVEWLNPGWQKIENEPSYMEAREIVQEGEKFLLYFGDDEERTADYETWVDERSEWKEQELPARKAMRIFERFYALHSTIERDNEQVELILGEGILNWKVASGRSMYHPVLLQKISLVFDPDIPEFKLRAADQPVEFYAAMFRDVPEATALSIQKSTADLELNPCYPLDAANTDSFLQRVVSHLSANGEFYSFDSDDKPKPSENVSLTIKRNPVLFLRKRSLGFASAIEKILNNLEQDANIPEAVTRITGIDLGETKPTGEDLSLDLDVNGYNEEILFTKEANFEQLDIALKVNKYGSVLVQGPPGTGKTHTIANLIGHFLSEGKNILVTSHTSKALHVLWEKVSPQLQGLCISVVDEDGGKNQLDQSIDAITERLNSFNERTYEEEIRLFPERRTFLLSRVRNINQDLRLIREHEYTPIVWLGEEFLPSEAARLVRNGEEQLSLIPGDVKAGAPLPITADELHQLYRTNGQISPQDELEFERLDLRPDELLKPDVFEAMVSEHNRLLNKTRDAHVICWEERAVTDQEKIVQIQRRAVEAISCITYGELWKHEILAAGWTEPLAEHDWLELADEISDLTDKYKKAKSVSYKYGPEIPTDIQEQEVANILKDIILFLESGKKLNFLNLRVLNRPWDKVIKSLKVNGAPPTEKEHFEAILTTLEHRLKRHSVITRWGRQVTALGGPSIESMGATPEDVLELMEKEIRNGQCH